MSGGRRALRCRRFRRFDEVHSIKLTVATHVHVTKPQGNLGRSITPCQTLVSINDCDP